MQRRRFYSLGLILALLIPLCASPATANVIEQVIVVVDGEPYTLTNFKDYARAQMGRDFPVGDLNRLGKEDQEVVEQFITDKLMAAEVKQTGIKVSEDDLDNYIAQIKEKNRIDDEQLREALRREGVSWEKYRGSIRAEIEKSDIIDSQVRKKVNITPEDVERYYSLNQKKFIGEEKVLLRHILLNIPEGAPSQVEKAVMDKAADIRRRALAGENFAKLAESYSEGAGAAEGGDTGWVTRGGLLKEIDQLAFGKLAIGEVSEPLRTSGAIHLIKLEAREGGKQLALADIREKVREEVIAKALDERFQKWLKGDLRRKHRVDVKLPGVVFRPEDTKEETMGSLVASGSKRRDEGSSFWSFLNPFKTSRTEEVDDGGRPASQAGHDVISLFGTPLFRTESADSADTVDEIIAPIEDPKAGADKPKESGGFWSSLNPFSKSK
jgi:peptidyl-prolyl cis-trans isomerase SurA